MKILIITMTCGEGHNKIAEAIKNEIDSRGNANECKVCQLYGFSQKEVVKQNKTFLRVCKTIPHLYEAVWKHNCRKPFKPYIKSTVKQCRKYVLGIIREYNPDVIICTHVNAGAVISALKSEGELAGIKTYSVVFDYCLCPYWEYNAGVDYAVIPHEDMTDEMIAKGYAPEQLLPFGLPVAERFTKSVDKRSAREELGLKQDVFTVALYSGGNCVSSAYKLIRQLQKCSTPMQIIAICGHNKKEFDKIAKYVSKRGRTNILNLGFCNKLDVVYSASDVVFTRGGGMGLTEQINKCVPFVLREKLIINERVNKRLFAQKGMAVAMDRLSDAPSIVDKLANDRAALQKMSDNARAYRKTTSTSDFVDHILNLTVDCNKYA